MKKRQKNLKEVFHLYEFRVINKNIRNKLLNYLQKNGIDAKIHYPIPMHLQPAAKQYKYKNGDFPICEKISRSTISLPVHEFVNKKQLFFITRKIKDFFYES